jgi:hypothetical protein
VFFDKLTYLFKGAKNMARTKQNIPENETKEAKFKRLAVARVNAALYKIKLVKNLACAQYGYTDEDVRKIEVALSDAIVDCVNSFNHVKIEKARFSL